MSTIVFGQTLQTMYTLTVITYGAPSVNLLFSEYLFVFFIIYKLWTFTSSLYLYNWLHKHHYL